MEEQLSGLDRSDSIKEEDAETTSDTNEEDNYCHCCGVKTPKARLHYGGITCYPCRSFFRRATVSKKKKKCKKAGRCKVKFDDRKACNPCRYNECLRNGMRPHLVLSEDQIQERFKNLSKKEKKAENETLDNESDPNFTRETNYEDTPGNLFDSLPTRTLSNYDCQEESPQRPSVLNMNKKFKINDNENYLLPLRQDSSQEEELEVPCHRAAQIGQQRSVIMMANRRTTSQDASQYLFDNNEEENRTEDEQRGESDLNLFLQDRSFVEFAVESDFNEVQEVDKMLLRTLNSIDIKQIENMYTIEEKSYIQFMGKKFRDKWCEVNIGPDVMQDYIAWCKKQGPLSQEMFAVVSRATCERFTRMVETTEEFQDLNIHDKFYLLKSNLKYADTVTMIRKLSFLNPKDDYFNSWGAEDRIIWNDSGMNLHPESMSNILSEMPFDVKLKQQFISLLVECKLPILADQHVFSLLVAVVIFSSGDMKLIERDTINNIREEYLTMMRRYVRQKEEDSEDIINRVMVVLSLIPKLSQLFRKMNIVNHN